MSGVIWTPLINHPWTGLPVHNSEPLIFLQDKESTREATNQGEQLFLKDEQPIFERMRDYSSKPRRTSSGKNIEQGRY
jgi:hypothetical protein